MTRRISLQFAAAVFLTIAAVLTAFVGGTRAEDMAPVRVGDIEVSSGWVRAMLPGQPSGGGFVTIANTGQAPDRLVAAASPAAGKVEIHTMEIINDVMVMRPVEDGLEIPAGGRVELKPGGLHLMFMDVAAPFAAGSAITLTLEFENAGKVEVQLPAMKPGSNPSSHGG